jgi:GNAT superfamily N-acetyltransferase
MSDFLKIFREVQEQRATGSLSQTPVLQNEPASVQQGAPATALATPSVNPKDRREQAIIDSRMKDTGNSFVDFYSLYQREKQIEARRQQRAYAEKAPPEAVKPVQEMLSSLGDRSNLLNIIRKMTPEQRQSALQLVPGVAQKLGDDRGGVISRTLGALSRGVAQVSQPIMEIAGIGGTKEEIEYIRKLGAAAAQEFDPALPSDPWYERGPLQAVQMTPWMATIVGSGGLGGVLGKSGGTLLARGAATGVPGAKTAFQAAGAIGRVPTAVGLKGATTKGVFEGAGTLAGITAAGFPGMYAQEVDQLKELGMEDDWKLRLLAGGTAVVGGAVEGIIPNPFGGKVDFTQGAMKAARQYLWESIKKAPAEMSEEYIQGVTSGLGEHIAQYIADEKEIDFGDGEKVKSGVKKKSIADAFAKGWEQTKEAALPMAFLLGAPAVPGAGLAARKARLYQLEQIRAKRFVSEKDAEEAGIEGDNRKERMANLEAEVNRITQEMQSQPSPDAEIASMVGELPPETGTVDQQGVVDRDPFDGEAGQPQVEAPITPTPLYEVAGDQNMVARVWQNPQGFLVNLTDIDSGEVFPTANIFPTFEQAKQHADTVRLPQQPQAAPEPVDTFTEYANAWSQNLARSRGTEPKPLQAKTIQSLRETIDGHADYAIKMGRSTAFVSDNPTLDALMMREIQKAVQAKGYQVDDVKQTTEGGTNYIGFNVIGSPQQQPQVAPTTAGDPFTEGQPQPPAAQNPFEPGVSQPQGEIPYASAIRSPQEEVRQEEGGADLRGSGQEQVRTQPESQEPPAQAEVQVGSIYEPRRLSEQERQMFDESRKAAAESQSTERPRPDEPPLASGMTRLYHGSAEKGRLTGSAWYSTDRQYAANYRDNAELQYIDVPTDWVNQQIDPDNYGQTVDKGFTLNVQLDSSDVGSRKVLLGQAEGAAQDEPLSIDPATVSDEESVDEMRKRGMSEDEIQEEESKQNYFNVVGDVTKASDKDLNRAYGFSGILADYHDRNGRSDMAESVRREQESMKAEIKRRNAQEDQQPDQPVLPSDIASAESDMDAAMREEFKRQLGEKDDKQPPKKRPPRKDGKSKKPSSLKKSKGKARKEADNLWDELIKKSQNKLLAGLDPELLTLAARIAIKELEYSAISFAEFVERSVAKVPGTLLEKLKPYLESAWRTAYDSEMTTDAGGKFDDYIKKPEKSQPKTDELQGELRIPVVGQPFTFTALHNKEKSPDMGSRFGQDKEPAGRYVVAVSDSNTAAADMPDKFDRRTVTFQNPLVIEFGGGYQEASNWKQVLSGRYGGLTGKALSQAIVDDGFDGIVTVEPAKGANRPAHTSEIVDLSTIKAEGKPAKPTPAEVVFGEITDGRKPDLQIAAVAANNQYGIWAKLGARWRFIGNAGANREQAIAKAKERAESIARGETTGVAFIGSELLAVKPKLIQVLENTLDPEQLVSAEKVAIGDQPVGFGKHANKKVKDLIEQEPGYVSWLIENATTPRAKQIVSYLLERPEFAAKIEQENQNVSDLVDEKSTKLLAKFGLRANASNGRIYIRGETYEWKDQIRNAGGRWNKNDEAWSLTAEGFQKLQEELRGLPVPDDATGGRLPAYLKDTELRRLREDVDGRPDSRKSPEVVAGLVGQDTKDLISQGLKIGMPQRVVNEQIEDVGSIVDSYKENKGLFLLASEPGSGKTFVLGGAIRELKKAGAKKFTYVTLRTELIGQIKNDLKAYGIDDVEFITYPAMRSGGAKPSDVLIFDEAHSVKNIDESQQAKEATKWIEKSGFTIFASATPMENPVQGEYLEPTGVFEELGGFKQFALLFGANVRKIDDQDIITWERNPLSETDAKRAQEYLTKRGVMVSRRIMLPENQVDSRFVKINVPDSDADRYEALAKAADENGRQLFGFGRPYIVNLQKRLLEAAKVDQAMDEAQAALDRGRFPIIFVETKAERKIDIPSLIERLDEYNRAVAAAEMMGDTKPRRKDFGLPPSGVVETLATYMDMTGESTIEIPSAEDVIQKRFGSDKVAVFTGSVTPSKAQKNLDAWRSGEKPLLVATMAKGGTGLSLHDKVGDHQTTQINVNLPWTATQVVQVTQRSARYGLKGKAEILWLFADNIPFDRMLSARVGGRMADMGASVHGQEIKGASSLLDWNFEGQSFAGEYDQQAEMDSPWLNASVEDENRWAGTTVSVSPKGKEEGYQGKVVRVLNKGETIEIQRDGFDSSTRVPAERVSIISLVDSKAGTSDEQADKAAKILSDMESNQEKMRQDKKRREGEKLADWVKAFEGSPREVTAAKDLFRKDFEKARENGVTDERLIEIVDHGAANGMFSPQEASDLKSRISVKAPWQMTREEYLTHRGANADMEREDFAKFHLSKILEGEPGVSVEGDKIVYRNEKGVPVGVTTMRVAGGQKVVDDTGVHPDYRRQGIATALYREAKKRGYDTGYVENKASAAAKHKIAVVDALAAGKPVPAKVLAGYPGLVSPQDKAVSDVDAVPIVTEDQIGGGADGTYDQMHSGLASKLVQQKMALGMKGIDGREYGIFEHSEGKWQLVSRPATTRDKKDPYAESSPESRQRYKDIDEAWSDMRSYYQLDPESTIEDGLRNLVDGFVSGDSKSPRITGNPDGKAYEYTGGDKRLNAIKKRAQTVANKTSAVQAVVVVGNVNTGVPTHAVIVSSPGFVGSEYNPQDSKHFAWVNSLTKLYPEMIVDVIVPSEEKIGKKSIGASELKPRDRFVDSDGQAWEVFSSRGGVVIAHPVVDGKPQVNKDSQVSFAVTDAAKSRHPEYKTDIVSVTKWKGEEEVPVSKETQEDEEEAEIDSGSEKGDERAEADKESAGRVVGGKTKVGKRAAHYEVVEWRTLIASHHPFGMAVNEDFPSEWQRYQRAYHTYSQAEKQEVWMPRDGFDVTQIIDTTRWHDRGPTMAIRKNGKLYVVGGTRRFMMLANQYRSFPDKGLEYHNALVAEADLFSFDANATSTINGMDEPVLIRVIDEPGDDIAKLIDELNADAGFEKDPAAEAASLGRGVGKNTIKVLREINDEETLAKFLDRKGVDVVYAMVSDNSELKTKIPGWVKNNSLTKDAKFAVQKAIMGAVIPDATLISQASPRILQSINGSLPEILSLNQKGGEWSLSERLKEAITYDAEFRSTGKASSDRNIDYWMNDPQMTFLEGFKKDPNSDGYRLWRYLLNYGGARKFRIALQKTMIKEARLDVEMGGLFAGLADPDVEPSMSGNEAFELLLRSGDIDGQAQQNLDDNLRNLPPPLFQTAPDVNENMWSEALNLSIAAQDAGITNLRDFVAYSVKTIGRDRTLQVSRFLRLAAEVAGMDGVQQAAAVSGITRDQVVTMAKRAFSEVLSEDQIETGVTIEDITAFGRNEIGFAPYGTPVPGQAMAQGDLLETGLSTEEKQRLSQTKLVDSNGDPMVVYHGTTSKFKDFKASTAPGWGKGIYFSDNQQQIRDEFATGEGGRVVSAFVVITNPSDGSYPGDEKVQKTAAWRRIASKWSDPGDAWGEDGVFAGDVLRELGYDGIIAKNSNNMEGLEVVAFSEGQVIVPASPQRQVQVDTPAFKAWFGDSKVVDEDGKPLVVYHGTESQFDAFKEIGINWFTTDLEDAADYDPARVVNAFLSLRNPADLNDDNIKELLKKSGIDPSDLFDLTQQGDKVKNVLMKNGYDGILVSRDDIAIGVRHYAAFNQNQIKSATGNRGTFDPNNPSILMQNQQQGGSVKGWTKFISAHRALIGATNKADFSTFIHEFFHPMRLFLLDRSVPAEKRADITDEEIEALEKASGAGSFVNGKWVTKWDVKAEEKAAKMWEQYWYEGDSPSSVLDSLFQKISRWMREIYSGIQEITGTPLPKEIRDLFDKLVQRGLPADQRGGKGGEPVSRGEPVLRPANPVTSIQNEVANYMALLRGSPGLVDAESETMDEWLEEAGHRLRQDPTLGDRLVKELDDKLRSPDQIEVAVLQMHYRGLENAREAAEDRLFAAKDRKDSVAAAKALREVDLIVDTMEEMEKVDKKIGTLQARAFGARKITLRSDFSRAALLRRGRAANGGERLSAEQTRQIAELAAELAKVQGDLAKAEQVIADLQRQDGVRQVVDDDLKKAPKTKTKSEPRQKAATAVQSFVKKFSSIFKPKGDSDTLMQTEDERMAEEAESVVMAYVEAGVFSYGELLANLRKEIGGELPVQAQAAFATAWEKIKAQGEIPIPMVNPGDVEGLTRIAREIEMAVIESGIVTEDQEDRVEVVLDAVWRSLQEIDPEITERQTMDALTGYGQFTPLSPDANKRLQRDINGQLLQMAKIKDLEAGIRPKATGVERREMSDDERALVRQVNEMKRNSNLYTEDEQGLLKTSIGAAMRATANRIRDLRKAMAEGKPITKTQVDLASKDKDLAEQKRILAEVTKDYREMFPRQGATKEQRLAAALRATEREIERVTEQLRTGDFSPRDRAEPVTSAELKAKQAELETLRAHRELIKAVQNKESIEKQAELAYIANLKNRYAEYEDRITHGYFGAKPKKAPLESDEITKHRRRLEEKKEEFFRLAAEWRLSQLSPKERVFDWARETSFLARAIMTSMDLSAVFRQGGPGTFAHPMLAKEAAKEMRRAIFSQEEEFNIAEQMSKHRLYSFAVQAKLEVTASAGRIQNQEEAYMGRWARDGIGKKGTKINKFSKAVLTPVAMSARAYTTYLNGLRFRLFVYFVDTLGANGQVTLDEAKAIANFINVSTGRGDFGSYNKVAANLSTVLFAPRYLASRFAYLGLPFYMLQDAKVSGRVKRLIAMEYARHALGVAGFLATAVALGGLLYDDDDEESPTVELDPRSTDFMKLKIGETRIDPLSGFGQIVTFLSQVGLGQKKTMEGEIVDLRGEKKKYGQDSTFDLTANFVRKKLAPIPAAGINIIAGEDVVGNKATVATATTGLFIPLAGREVVETLMARGVPEGPAIAMLNILGMSGGTYGPKTKYKNANAEERKKLIEKDLEAMEWDSKDPGYKDFLTRDELERFKQRREQRKQSLVYSASANPKRKDFQDDTTYAKAVAERDKALKTMIDGKIGPEEARLLLLAYWRRNNKTLYERKGQALVMKDALVERLRQITQKLNQK